MNIANLTRYVCGDGEMIACKKDKNYHVETYVKLENVVELLKQADNSTSTPCEQCKYENESADMWPCVSCCHCCDDMFTLRT